VTDGRIARHPDETEDAMKTYGYIAMCLMVASLFIGCATTYEERKEEYELRKSVGNSAFVGLHQTSPSDNWRSP
jgi:hypothetical protein